MNCPSCKRECVDWSLHDTDCRYLAATDSLQTVMDDAIETAHDSVSEETFTYCNLCGLWEEHHPTCPIPSIIQFMES